MRHSLTRSNSSSIIQLRAAQHRSSLTPSESRLWSRLNARQLGVTFRRQVPLGRYIADFLAPVPRLVVEVDGASHRDRSSRDASRDRKLTRMGYRVLRIEAALVMQDLEAAMALVRAALAEAP